MTTQLNNFEDLGILNSDSELPNDGFVAPLDGSQRSLTASGSLTSLTASGAQNSLAGAGSSAAAGIAGKSRAPLGIDGKQAAGSAQEALAKLALGPNNEHLEELRPDLVNALRELVVEYRQEGMVARRHEIRRIRQARLFWQGLQYAWWNPQDMTWHLPYESKMYDDSAAAEMPRYQFVTNIYQAFGLSFISILSQDVPAKNIDQQLSQQNTMNQQIYGSSQALNSQAAGGYQNLLANPGYSQAQQSAITNASQSALGSSFDALAQNAANRAARTRNSAGYGELIDSLARTHGQDQATSRSRIKLRSPTPRGRTRCPRSPASPVCTAPMPTCSAAPSACPRSCWTPARATRRPADSASAWGRADCRSASEDKHPWRML